MSTAKQFTPVTDEYLSIIHKIRNLRLKDCKDVTDLGLTLRALNNRLLRISPSDGYPEAALISHFLLALDSRFADFVRQANRNDYDTLLIAAVQYEKTLPSNATKQGYTVMRTGSGIQYIWGADTSSTRPPARNTTRPAVDPDAVMLSIERDDTPVRLAGDLVKR
jgi:hypothetical protein